MWELADSPKLSTKIWKCCYNDEKNLKSKRRNSLKRRKSRYVELTEIIIGIEPGNLFTRSSSNTMLCDDFYFVKWIGHRIIYRIFHDKPLIYFLESHSDNAPRLKMYMWLIASTWPTGKKLEEAHLENKKVTWKQHRCGTQQRISTARIFRITNNLTRVCFVHETLFLSSLQASVSFVSAIRALREIWNYTNIHLSNHWNNSSVWKNVKSV